MVPVLVPEENEEFDSSNDVDGDFRGSLLSGMRFCRRLVSPSLVPPPVGERCAFLLAVVGRLYLSLLVLSAGGCDWAPGPAAALRSNLFRISLTVPGVGSSTRLRALPEAERSCFVAARAAA